MTCSHPDCAHARAGTAADGPGTSRRSVLGLAVVAGAGFPLLAACGGDDSAETDAGGGGGSPSAAASDDSSDGASDDAAAGAGLVATADVPVKGGVVLKDAKIVVTQPSSGEFKAFTAVCTHQQCLVADVANNTISCPCHGSAYSAADGSVQNGPATTGLREIPVSVEGDEVVRA